MRPIVPRRNSTTGEGRGGGAMVRQIRQIRQIRQTRAAMVGQGAMADHGAQEAMAVQGTQEDMAV